MALFTNVEHYICQSYIFCNIVHEIKIILSLVVHKDVIYRVPTGPGKPGKPGNLNWSWKIHGILYFYKKSWNFFF